MTNERPTIYVFDAQTQTDLVRPMTDEEYEQYLTDQKNAPPPLGAE